VRLFDALYTSHPLRPQLHLGALRMWVVGDNPALPLAESLVLAKEKRLAASGPGTAAAIAGPAEFDGDDVRGLQVATPALDDMVVYRFLLGVLHDRAALMASRADSAETPSPDLKKPALFPPSAPAAAAPVSPCVGTGEELLLWAAALRLLVGMLRLELASPRDDRDFAAFMRDLYQKWYESDSLESRWSDVGDVGVCRSWSTCCMFYGMRPVLPYWHRLS
jgi:hypothetical protein